MTTSLPDTRSSQRTHRTIRTIQHAYATSQPPTSRQRPKIKNFTAHPRITIRRVQEPLQSGQCELISKLTTARSVRDLETGV
jgi:hypothetical protein